VEPHRCSAKHQRNSFREAESNQTFLKDLCTRFCRQAIFVPVQQNKDFYRIGRARKNVHFPGSLLKFPVGRKLKMIAPLLRRKNNLFS